MARAGRGKDFTCAPCGDAAGELLGGDRGRRRVACRRRTAPRGCAARARAALQVTLFVREADGAGGVAAQVVQPLFMMASRPLLSSAASAGMAGAVRGTPRAARTSIAATNSSRRLQLPKRDLVNGGRLSSACSSARPAGRHQAAGKVLDGRFSTRGWSTTTSSSSRRCLEILYIVVACLIILVSEPPSSDVRRALPCSSRSASSPRAA